jgi:hypothetical protein
MLSLVKEDYTVHWIALLAASRGVGDKHSGQTALTQWSRDAESAVLVLAA